MLNTSYNNYHHHKSATAAHIYESYKRNALDETDRPQHRDYNPALFDKCVGSFKFPDRRLRDWTYGLTSLFEKTRRLEQRQHLLLNYFKTLSVGPAGNRTQASRTIDWHLTNWANHAVSDFEC